MRRLKEIIVLAALLAGAVAFVLWYVVDRRERQRSAPTVTKSVGPFFTGEGIEGESADGKTLNLSAGRPSISETPEDRAAMIEAMSDIRAAAGDTLFTPEEQAAAAKRAAEPKEDEDAEKTADEPPKN